MRKVISKDGTAIAFDQVGKGQSVILIDGGMCYRGFGPMGALSALLSPHFTVFTYDRRGRGESSDTAPYSIRREVEDLDALVREAGGSAFVYGISSGAMLAMEASACGVALSKLALYEPPYMTDGHSSSAHVDHKAQINAFVAAGHPGDAVEYFMTRMVGLPQEAAAGARQAPMWPRLEAIAPTLAYDAALTEIGAIPTERLASIRASALVMYGGATPAWASTAANTVSAAIPQAQCRTLEGQTHDVSADALAPVLIEFFSS
jgi:pimeloyl-ACP methyl ester carboxylesterase